MEDWQGRVIEEKRELDARIGKLDVFLRRPDDGKIPREDLQLLNDQKSAMDSYSYILACRIDRFT